MPGGPAPYRRRDRAQAADFASIVFDLKLTGLSYRAIDALTQAPDGPTGGHRISTTTAKELVYEEAARRVDPRVDTWRNLSLERLEAVIHDHVQLRNANWDKAMAGQEKPTLAVDRALTGIARGVEQQSKLLGLHVTKIEAQVTEVTQEDLELQEMIRAAKAKVRLEEEALLAEEQAE